MHLCPGEWSDIQEITTIAAPEWSGYGGDGLTYARSFIYTSKGKGKCHMIYYRIALSATT